MKGYIKVCGWVDDTYDVRSYHCFREITYVALSSIVEITIINTMNDDSTRRSAHHMLNESVIDKCTANERKCGFFPECQDKPCSLEQNHMPIFVLRTNFTDRRYVANRTQAHIVGLI